MCAKPSSGETVLAGLKPYPRMRDSGVEWLGDVPAHWEVRKLKHWLVVNRSTLSGDTHPDFAFDYLDIGSVGTGNLVAPPQRMRFQGSPSRARRVVREGDTIISTVRTYLKAVWYARDVQSDLIASTGFAVLTPTPSTYPGFVGYVCQSSSFTDRVSANSVGVAYPAIAETKFSSFEVAVPPLPEQTAIARFLDHATDRIDRYIRAKEKLIALLEEQQRAIINEAVTGRIDVRTGRPYAAYKTSGLNWPEGVPNHWSVARNGQLFVQRHEVGYPELPILEVSLRSGVNVRDFESSNRKQVMSDHGMYKRAVKGDIAYNMMRMWQGAVGVAPVDGLVSPAYVVARPRPGTEPRYFDHLYHTSAYMTEVNKYSRGIVPDRNRLYWEDFKQMPAPRPPADEQCAIADYIDREGDFTIDQIRTRQEQIDLAEEYRARLIADVVTGKLDVREMAPALPRQAEAIVANLAEA